MLTANIAGRPAVPPLASAIDHHRPAAVVVTEAYRARSWLRGIPGYRSYQYWGTEARGIAILVRQDLRSERRKPLRMRRAWEWNGRTRLPRKYPVLWLGDDDGPIGHLIGPHLPPGGPDGLNRRAWVESMRRITRRMSHYDHATAPGDWNALGSELVPWLPHGFQLMLGTKVDHNVTVGMRDAGRVRLDAPDGMHGWVVYKLQRAGT
jgi:hypothetical protein